MGTRQQAYDLCMQQMGTYGGEPYWSWLCHTPWKSPGGTPHCAAGVSWVLAMTDTRCPYLPAPCAHDYRDDMEGRDVDRWHLEFMDPISFDWYGEGKGCHEAFFLEYLGDGLCRTAEFNTSGGWNQVCVRDVNLIICGIRPYWDEEDEMTEADWSRLDSMLNEKVTKAAMAVWSFKNPDLEQRDAYQILRDIRTALGVNDGQTLNEYCIRYEDAGVSRIEKKVR